MASFFDESLWRSMLLAGDIAGCESQLNAERYKLDMLMLDDLQKGTLGVFIDYAAQQGPVIEPLLGLHSILLVKNDLIAENLARFRDDPVERHTYVQLREETNQWRRVVMRALLGNIRGSDEWEAITADLTDAVIPYRKSTRDVLDSTILGNFRTVLDAHDIEDVVLNEGHEVGLRHFVIRQRSPQYTGARREGANRGLSEYGRKIDVPSSEAFGPVGAASAVRPEDETPQVSASTSPLKLTPHMDAPAEPIELGVEFDVRIYADKQDAREGEDAEAIAIDLPQGIEEAAVETWLSSSSHFEILGSTIDVLHLRRGAERSENTVAFKLRARQSPEVTGGIPRITAYFSFQGAPAGKVTRVVAVAKPAVRDEKTREEPRTQFPDAKPELLIGLRRRPDLEVHITRHPDEVPWKFNCRISGPFTLGTTAVWNIPDQLTTQDFVEKRLSLFCQKNISDGQRPDLLRGAGKELFDVAPSNFKAAYWRLIDEQRPPGSIAVYSEEGSIPWELMVPHRQDGSPKECRALGVDATVGRWVHANSLPPPQDCILTSSYTIVPEYAKPLKYAQAEGEMVRNAFNGIAVDPPTYEKLKESLAERAVSLLHFACHGRSDANGQSISLANNEPMYAVAARGSPEFRTGFESAPLVFLNACEVGRQEIVLAGPQGFAPVFTELGATGVIAAIWSVEDEVAHEVAKTLYEAILAQTDCSPAAILRKLRQRSYVKNGRDSYAAYCFYGDPLLICRAGPPRSKCVNPLADP
jgi:CHAT domain